MTISWWRLTQPAATIRRNESSGGTEPMRKVYRQPSSELVDPYYARGLVGIDFQAEALFELDGAVAERVPARIKAASNLARESTVCLCA